MEGWLRSPQQAYGGSLITDKPQQSDDARALAGAAGPASTRAANGAFHPSSPLFWFGVVAAASVGLMAYSTTVRVGPISASVSAGK